MHITSGSALPEAVGPAQASACSSDALVVPCRPDTVLWGRLPSRRDQPVASVASGATVIVDTISHEGALEDQGRDPAHFFRQFGIEHVLADLVECANALKHDPARDGPHFVTGPIEIADAQPGDVLRIDILSLETRCDYGVVSDRHAKDVFGAEPALRPWSGEAPLFELVRVAGAGFASLAVMQDFPSVSLAPFLGIMGVAPDSDERLHSSPPGEFGGNLDLRHLIAGTSLLLPVQVPGALFFIGDPHFVQGNGELASTALEAPLRAKLRLRVISGDAFGGPLPSPACLTDSELIVCGLDRDLGRAVRLGTRHTLHLLERCGLPAQRALAWLSMAADVEVTQVVDGILGAHLRVPLDAFGPLRHVLEPLSAGHAAFPA